MRLGVGRSGEVHLRERAERTSPRDADVIAALDHGLDRALHGQAGVESPFEFLLGGGPAREPARKRESTGGVDDDGLEAVADGHLELAVLALQLGHVHHRFALGADVDESHFVADAHDSALDGLSLREARGARRGFEQRREVLFGEVFGFGHPFKVMQISRAVRQQHLHDPGLPVSAGDGQQRIATRGPRVGGNPGGQRAPECPGVACASRLEGQQRELGKVGEGHRRPGP